MSTMCAATTSQQQQQQQLSCEVKGNKLLATNDIENTPNGMKTRKRRSFRTNANCIYSRTTTKTNISFLIALTVSYGFLIVFPFIQTSFLVATSAERVTASDSAENSAVSSYLLYSSKLAAGVEKTKSASENDVRLERLLKDANHSHVSDTINLELANQVWLKMRTQLGNYAQERANLVRPSIERLLDKAEISSVCRQSLLNTIDHLAKLEDWAVRMYNSFGNFPAAGLFEGTHTSMGSYHQCVNVEPNEWIGRPKYCTYKFQPIIPKRPRYHNILATIENLANFTSSNDILHGLAKKAHYFYYTKLRLATCMPTKCENSDLERLGGQIAINTYLQYQGVECLEKSQGFNPDQAQIFALTILVLMASVSLLATLVHLLDVRSYLGAAVASAAAAEPHHLKGIECGNGKGAFEQAIVQAQQQQKLLSSSGKQTAPILPAPLMHTIRNGSAAQRLLVGVDFLMHFSIIRNGKKLFDTSTSRRKRGQSRASSLLPGMREAAAVVIGGGVGHAASSSSGQSSSASSVASSSSSACQSDSSSVDGRSNDISCVHGLRFWTISWIILGHTMQYTEWAGFGRAYQVEQNITSFFLHPLLNATFSVDTFFLISGLLTTYVTWSITRGQLWRFNKFAFLISRYLRLMPQVLIVILLFIAFPLMSDGPYWRGFVQKESDNCKRNWWVSALFLQSFYRSDQICNLVTWWLSIEMFYHFTSIIVIIALLHSAKKGIFAALAVGGGLTAVSCYLHYANSYPPNMLPTLLQRYEIWDSIVLKYFWTPYPHAPSYFVGLMLGYALNNRSITQLSKQQVRIGWFAFSVSYLAVLFGTYHWNNNAPYSRLVSTTYYNLSQVIWSFATGWAILACALGKGGWLNDFLSSPVFVPLGRATYMTYLSHMLIVMSYPAKQNLLIEPSYIVFLYIYISNLCLSYMLGITLTLVYESPILHLQKLLVTGMAQKFNGEEPAAANIARARKRNAQQVTAANASVKVSLYDQQTELQIKSLDEEEQHGQVPAAN